MAQDAIAQSSRLPTRVASLLTISMSVKSMLSATTLALTSTS